MINCPGKRRDVPKTSCDGVQSMSAFTVLRMLSRMSGRISVHREESG